MKIVQITMISFNYMKTFSEEFRKTNCHNGFTFWVCCQFPCSHNCETPIFFSHNMPKTPVTSQTSVRSPTQKLLTWVPDVCPSTNAKTIDSSTSRLSFDRRRNCWLTSQPSVLRPSQLLMTHVPDVCPPTITETKCHHLSAPSKTRIAITTSLSY